MVVYSRTVVSRHSAWKQLGRLAFVDLITSSTSGGTDTHHIAAVEQPAESDQGLTREWGVGGEGERGARRGEGGCCLGDRGRWRRGEGGFLPVTCL